MPDDRMPDIHAIRFLALVDSLYHAAMTFLGKVADPISGETKCELDKAQVYIDFIATLEEKTKNNLSKVEKDHLEQLLESLRLNYVDELERQKREKASGEEKAGGEEKEAGEEESRDEEAEEEQSGGGERSADDLHAIKIAGDIDIP